MKQTLLLLILALAISKAQAQVKDEQTAPDFSVLDSQGQTQKLSNYRGKIVVLEWINVKCPLVKKHYESNNVPKMQKDLAARDVVWLTVISSAKGKMGYCTPDQANAYIKETGAAPTAVLLDSDGIVGHLYGAKVTPHLFIIDRQGTLRYQGALDSDNSVDPTTIPDSENYVKAALEDLFAGRPIAKPVTKPYGCSVKY